MKLAIIFPESLPLKKARAISTLHTAVSLSKKMDTTLIIPKDSASKSRIEEFYNVNLNSLKILYINNKFFGIKSNKIFNFNLLKVVSQFDVFYVRHLKTAKFLIKHKKNTQKLIFEVHEMFSESLKEENCKVYKIEKLKKLEEFVYKNSDALVFINNTLKKFWEEKIDLKNIRKTTIYLASTFLPAFKRKDFKNIKEIYYCGSLYKWKGLEVALKALSFVKNKNLVLNIIGGEKERIKELKELSRKLDIEHKVNFIEFLLNSQIQDILLNKAKLTLIPNTVSIHNYFSFPIKLLEYMATSNIVIASDTPVIKEILENEKNGFLFETGNPYSLFKVLEKIFSLPSKTLEEISQNAYNTAKGFTYEKRAEKIIELINELSC